MKTLNSYLVSTMFLLAALCLLPTPLAIAEENVDGTGHPIEIEPEVLAMQIKHLNAEELQAEANRWLERLKHVVQQLNAVKEEVWRENQVLEATKSAGEEAEDRNPGRESDRLDAELEAEKARKDETLEKLAACARNGSRLLTGSTW